MLLLLNLYYRVNRIATFMTHNMWITTILTHLVSELFKNKKSAIFVQGYN